MTLDIRATATCSLGPLISANFSDDYLQLNGLVKTQGSCVLKGLYTPSLGQYVTFTYTRNGITKTIPKKLRVLSFFCDPYEKTTSITLGCTLTYLSDLKEAINWSQYDDPNNADEEPSEIVLFPISASSIANECLSKLQLTANRMPLTNKFSIESFDYSSGYVQILSDLLVSEGYFGYLNENDVLIITSLNVPVNSAPVLTADQIITIGEINSGALPGESVVVSYSSLKLNKPEKDSGTDEAEEDDLVNWDKSINVGKSQDYVLNAKDRDGNEYEITWTYAPWSEETTYYDDWDRAYKKVKDSYNLNADFANGFFSDLIASCFGNNKIQNIRAQGSGTYFTRETTTTTYAMAVQYGNNGKPIKEKPEGYDDVLLEVTSTREPAGKVHAGCQYNFTAYSGGYFITDFNEFRGSDITTRYKEVKYEKAQIDNTLYNGKKFDGTNSQLFKRTYPSNRTTTTEYACYGYTSRGQTYISKQTENGKRFYALKLQAQRLVYDGTGTDITTGRQIGLKERPSSDSRKLDKATSEDVDPNNGYSTSSEAGMTLVFGNANATRRVEFSMPYAPDDTFYRTYSETDPETGATLWNFGSSPSDAPAKARNFGRIQSRLLFGSRNGMNVQTTPENLPNLPFRHFAIQAGGLTGLYATNAISWTIDSSGIIISTDAMFWQPVGGSGNTWFPTPPGTVSLPPAPVSYTLNPTVLGSITNVYQ
jgi:hypothetical protein